MRKKFIIELEEAWYVLLTPNGQFAFDAHSGKSISINIEGYGTISRLEEYKEDEMKKLKNCQILVESQEEAEMVLKILEECCPHLRWSSDSRPTEFVPTRNKFYIMIFANRLSYGLQPNPLLADVITFGEFYCSGGCIIQSQPTKDDTGQKEDKMFLRVICKSRTSIVSVLEKIEDMYPNAIWASGHKPKDFVPVICDDYIQINLERGLEDDHELIMSYNRVEKYDYGISLNAFYEMYYDWQWNHRKDADQSQNAKEEAKMEKPQDCQILVESQEEAEMVLKILEECCPHLRWRNSVSRPTKFVPIYDKFYIIIRENHLTYSLDPSSFLIDVITFSEFKEFTESILGLHVDDQSAKSDAGKPKLTLVPQQIIYDIAKVREYGNKKYGDPENWRTVEPERYRDAAFRHLLAYLDDPYGVDSESGLPHLWHLACNVAFLCEMEKGKNNGQT